MIEGKKIVIKYATRGRPTKCLALLNALSKTLTKKDNYVVLLTFDLVDKTFYNKAFLFKVKTLIQRGLKIELESVNPSNKVKAFNAGLKNIKDWDFVIHLKDSDEIKCNTFFAELQRYVNTDKIYQFPYSNNPVNEQYYVNMFGRKIFDQYGFLYNPKLMSNFYNEEMEVRLKPHLMKMENKKLFYSGNPKLAPVRADAITMASLNN